MLPVEMNKVLVTWIGHADLRAAEGMAEAGAGTIAQDLAARAFDAVALLSDHSPEATARYVEWLKQRGAPRVDVAPAKLSGPTQFGEIYQRATEATEQARKAYGPDVELTFHVSPGTPTMA